MTALQEQGEQTLQQQIGNLDGRLCTLEGKVDDLEMSYALSSGSCGTKTKSRLPPELCVSYFNLHVIR